VIRFIIGLVIGIVAVIFAAQNPESISYTFLFWEITAPRALVVIAVLLAGMIVGWFLTGLRRIGSRRKR